MRRWECPLVRWLGASARRIGVDHSKASHACLKSSGSSSTPSHMFGGKKPWADAGPKPSDTSTQVPCRSVPLFSRDWPIRVVGKIRLQTPCRARLPNPTTVNQREMLRSILFCCAVIVDKKYHVVFPGEWQHRGGILLFSF